MRKLLLVIALVLVMYGSAAATDITISSTQLANSQGYSGSIRLRIYFQGCPGTHFLDSNNVPVMCGSPGSQTGFYKEVTVTVSMGTLTIPSYVLPSTDDAIPPTVTATAIFFVNGTRRDTLFSNWVITNSFGSTASFSQLHLFNRSVVISSPPPTFLSTREVIALIQTTGIGAVSSVFGRTGAVTAQTNDYTWAQINKTTSSLADITTRSASDINSGELADVRLSANIPRLNAANTFTQQNVIPSIAGGAAANSALTLRPTTSGAPISGADLILMTGTSTETLRLLYPGNQISLPQANSMISGAVGLTLEETGDSFGSMRFKIQNRTGLNGVLVQQVGSVNLVDLQLENLTNQTAIRYEGRTSDDFVLAPELQLGTAADPTLVISPATNSAFRKGNLGVGTITPRKLVDALSTTQAQLRLSYADNATYTDFTTNSAGNLVVVPTGSITFDATSNQIDPVSNYDQNLGQFSKKYLQLHAAELVVETLVAQNTLATVGGRILVAPSTVLTADLAPATTVITTKHNNLVNGDRVYMEANGQVEFMAITSAASGGGPYTYTVTRNLDGTGADQWYAGDALVNTGQTGSGFMDLYSNRGVRAATEVGPTIVGNTRNSSTFNDWSPVWAIGNLRGLYGYASDAHGVAFGKYAAGTPHLTIDSTNGILFKSGLSTVIGRWNNAGEITVGEVASGKSNVWIAGGALAIRNNVTDRILLNSDGSGFLANNQISWDSSGNLSVSANATIAGWSVTANRLGSGSGSSTVGLDTTVTGGDDIRIFAGNSTPGSAPFRVTEAGALTASNATITGSITASSGSITGPLTMSGASASIAIGTTPPTSASAGTGIWLDRTGLYGLASNVVQAKLDATTGAITAGAGNVTLDASGVKLGQGSGTVNMIRWTIPEQPSIAYGSIFTSRSGSTDIMNVKLNSDSLTPTDTNVSDLTVSSNNSSAHDTSLWLRKYGPSHATKPSQGFATLIASNGVAIVRGTWPYSFQEAAASAALDIQSTTGALLFPRMTTTQRDALTPTNGMVIYNSTTDKLQVRAAGAWVDLH